MAVAGQVDRQTRWDLSARRPGSRHWPASACRALPASSRSHHRKSRCTGRSRADDQLSWSTPGVRPARRRLGRSSRGAIQRAHLKPMPADRASLSNTAHPGSGGPRSPARRSTDSSGSPGSSCPARPPSPSPWRRTSASLEPHAGRQLTRGAAACASAWPARRHDRPAARWPRRTGGRRAGAIAGGPRPRSRTAGRAPASP